jgi:hypothetical protein
MARLVRSLLEGFPNLEQGKIEARRNVYGRTVWDRIKAVAGQAEWPKSYPGTASMSSGKFKPEGNSPQAPAADLWRHTLARIPTLFGRLVYLSSLLGTGSGLYEHPALSQMFGDEQADETLRRSHARVFQDWLCLNLEQQKADLHEYLAELPGNPAAAFATWTNLAPYRNLVPPGAQDVERQLYMTDLEMLLELLKREFAGVSLDRES